MDNRRLFLAALLSLVVLLGWNYLFPAPEPVRPAPAPRATAPAPAAAATPGAATSEPAPAPALAPAVPAVTLPPISAAAESEVEIDAGDLVARFSTRGAELRSLRLKSDLEGASGGIELVQGRTQGPYPFALAGADGQALPELGAALFVAERTRDEGDESVVFRYRGPAGDVEKRFRFRPGALVDVDITARGIGSWSMLLGPGLRRLTAEELGNRFERRLGSWLVGTKIEDVIPAKLAEPQRLDGGGLRFAALEDSYFLVAAMPRAGLAQAIFDPVLLRGQSGDPRLFDATPLPPAETISDEQKKLPRDLRLRLVAQGEALGLSTFWGAKQYDRLAAMPYGLEGTVRWGMFGFLARPLLWALQWLHAHVVENYGWAIVLMTIALKIVLLPLTVSAMVSMQKMQKLNPKIQAIRERFRGKLKDKQGRFNPDAQKQMNAEIMGLYKTEGVNPAGGCLPMLLQIPVFFAFYNLLSTAVELWHAPWIGWVRDLSAPDPYYVLPLLMGATQFLQQKMTPAAGDPIQRRMFQLFPIIFTVFSLGFPSGLVLYWLVNNILTIGQQGGYNSWKARREAATVPAKRGGRA